MSCSNLLFYEVSSCSEQEQKKNKQTNKIERYTRTKCSDFSLVKKKNKEKQMNNNRVIEINIVENVLMHNCDVKSEDKQH